MPSISDIRTAFEACKELQDCSFSRDSRGAYVSARTRGAWAAWQALSASTALQAPVREVPANTHKLITSTSLIDLRGDLAVAAALGESIILSPESMKAILHAMRTGRPLPSAPVQQEGDHG